MKNNILCWLAAALFALPALHAGQIGASLQTAANDTVSWLPLGIGTTPDNPFSIASTTGNVTATVTNLNDSSSPNSKSAVSNNFLFWGFLGTSTAILDNQFNGPTTIAFSAPVTAAGLFISDAFGATAFVSGTIEAFDGNTLLESYTVDANGHQQIYLGVDDTTADITEIEISTTDLSGGNYFGLGQVDLIDTAPEPSGPSPVPEPATLVVTAFATLLLARKR